MKNRTLTTLTIAAMSYLLIACNHGEFKSQLMEIKETPYGRKFLEDHSERDLERMILFFHDPERYFREIRQIKDWCAYMAVYDSYQIRIMKSKGDAFFSFLDGHFKSINQKKASILAFLLLNGENCGFYGEVIADFYTKLFVLYPDVFINELRTREDWREVIGSLGSGNWIAFKTGLAKLGNSEFEKELRTYVAELEKRWRGGKQN